MRGIGFKFMMRCNERQGVTIAEMLIVAVVLSFIVGATMRLYNLAQHQQLQARMYSQAQGDLRIALRRATRVLRHGYAAKATSTKSNFPSGSASSSTQIIVPIPETDTNASNKEIRVYYSNGSLYAQRSDQTGSGTLLISGLRTSPGGATFNYYKTSGVSTTEVASSPDTATEVRITLWAVRFNVTTSVSAYAALRNVISGGF